MVRDARRTAVVVDYDAWERSFAMDVLSTQGYWALGASNGASGLRLVEHNECDLILLDCALPELSGYEVLRQLKTQETTRDIPVVLLGPTDPGLDCPSDGRLLKPLTRQQVLREVERVVSCSFEHTLNAFNQRKRTAGSVIVVASADAALADRIAERLRRGGSVACTAHSANGCLRVATSIGPDVVLLDPKLPTRAGLEKLLRSHPVSAAADIVQLPELLTPHL
jgi:DNA-binding response OmpR family regulator